MSRYVMVPVFPETKERLRAIGFKGETYDALVNRLLDHVEDGMARPAQDLSTPSPSPRP